MLGKTLNVATLLCVIGLTVATTSPVFLWGANSPNKPTLQTVLEKEFAEDVVAPLLKDYMVVAFLEDNLSSNDFLCSNTEDSGSCYAHLQGVSPKTYYASVEKPIEALRSVATVREFNNVDKSGKLETPLECAAGKVVFVNLDSGNEGERGSTLESHDAAISAITKEISCPVAYMYMSTAQTAVKQRQRRALIDTGAPVGGYYFRDATKAQFLLFYSKLIFVSSNTTTNNAKPTLTEIVITDMKVVNQTAAYTSFLVTLTANSGKTVEFNMSSSGGYFLMGNVEYDGVFYRTTPEISAPYSFSFSCGNLTLGAIPANSGETNTNTLSWQYLQFQAPFGQPYNETFIFGDAWSCTGFFTAGILMGLFVVLIMLIIIFIGICWMMDINTMDRFDDPKGKTITINAAE